MSTALLHYGANERKHIMLQKLGGQKVLAEATDEFYNRQVHDERLLKFFHGTDLAILKWHQFNLMGIAFTAVPENFNARHLILVRHRALFDAGLDETYFDVVMGHFRATLEEMKVDQEVIHEALDVVMPLRTIFVQGAEEARERREKQARRELLARCVVVAVATTLAFAVGFSRRSKTRV